MTAHTELPTSLEDFEVFKSEAQRWIAIFGLTEWKVWFTHEALDQAAAACRTTADGRAARLMLGLTKSTEPVEDNVGLNAFHEVCHLLLAEVIGIANARYVNREELERAEHSVIRRLERALYPSAYTSTPPNRSNP